MTAEPVAVDVTPETKPGEGSIMNTSDVRRIGVATELPRASAGEIVPVRIRFAGTKDADTFRMTSEECARFRADWMSFLDGGGPGGGEYATEEGDRSPLISLNFSVIAYIEPGKAY